MAKFRKGEAANPAGRPKGIPDRRTALRSLLQPNSEALIQKAVELALEGDQAALRMCLDRICPTMKATAEPIKSGLPTTGKLSDQAAAIYKAVANGEIGTDEAGALIQVLQGQARIIEASELSARIEALENQVKELPNGHKFRK